MEDPAKHLVELYLKAKVIRVNGDKDPSDEYIPNSEKLRLNFTTLFSEYPHELAKIFVEAIYKEVYRKIGVDVILGVGDSGVTLTTASNMLSEMIRADEIAGEEIKNYRHVGVSKTGEIRGELKPNDRLCPIDEVGITYNTLIRWLGYIYGAVDGIAYPVVIVGWDLGLRDKEGTLYREKAELKINKYNSSNGYEKKVKIIPIATTQDFLNHDDLGEKEREALEDIVKDKEYSQPVKARTVA
ncbi:MAG: hypothetical protein J7K73_02295 [Nanoarchaeota archaeon]|nr:hypothetical protein [Nanoarchaeota archaeon]